MSTVIGNLRAVLGLDSSAFQKGLGDSVAGLKKAGQEMSSVKGSLNGLQSTMRTVGKMMGALGVALSVRSMADMADGWSDLQSRVGLAVGDMDRAGSVMQRLSDIADRTYSSINQTAEGFLQNATTLRDLGLSTDQALDYTEALNNAMVVSGAKGQQAMRVQNALSNAMALGALRGDNLNTILTTGGRVAELIAEEMGVTTLELRKLGQQGKLTGDVILRALVGNMEKLRAEAEEMPATIGDAFVRIGNAMQRLVGSFDQFFGASESVAGVLIKVAENLGRLMSYVAAAVVGFGTRYVGALVAARIANMSFVASLTALRTALVRTGIGVLIVGAGELVYQFSRLVSATGSFGGALKELGDLGRLVLQGLVDSAAAIPPGLAALWAKVKIEFHLFVLDLQGAWSGFLQFMVASTDGTIFSGFTEGLLAAQSKANDALEETLKSISLSKLELEGASAEAADVISDAFAPVNEAWAALSKRVDEAGESASTASTPLGDLGNAVDGSGKRASGAKDKLSDLQRVMKDLREESERLAATMWMGVTETAVWDNLRAAGVSATSSAGKEIEAITRQIEGMKEMKSVTEEWRDTFKGAFQELIAKGGSFRKTIASIIAKLAEMSFSRGFMALWDGGLGKSLSGALRAIGIPGFAAGVSHFRGGMAEIHERGGELAIMPSGSTVIPHDLSKRMVDGQQQGGRFEISVTMDPSTGSLGAIVRDEAGRQIASAAPQIVGASVSATRRSMQKTKSGWGI